jgi:hypothetical protein
MSDGGPRTPTAECSFEPRRWARRTGWRCQVRAAAEASYGSIESGLVVEKVGNGRMPPKRTVIAPPPAGIFPSFTGATRAHLRDDVVEHESRARPRQPRRPRAGPRR